ncbi:MAG: hypothetical protein IMZ55_10315 [Acidobacteria bacterium]|nr:hypothetical protein [Acidobacteriota bacterium]
MTADPTVTLAEDVIARHVELRSTQNGDSCGACGYVWPCDAYRLAVMVRDIEARAHEWRDGPVFAFANYIAGDEILAITREEKR